MKKKQQEGFALLLTLIVVSVVIALGLSMVEISLRQLNLSGVSRDSEIAFHAAYIGNECAEYFIRSRNLGAEYYTQERPDGLSNSNNNNNHCVDGGLSVPSYNDSVADVYHNNYEITWADDAGDERCTEIDIYVLDAVDLSSPLTYDFGGSLGYKNKSCADGRLCTLVFSRGYNRACNDIGTLRTLQREVVSEF